MLSTEPTGSSTLSVFEDLPEVMMTVAQGQPEADLVVGSTGIGGFDKRSSI